MKKKIMIIFASVVLLTSVNIFGQRKSSDFFFRPQVGAWFGTITPLFEVADKVDTDLGIGAYFRYNSPFQAFKLGLDVSYQNYTSDTLNELTIVPAYANVLYLLPFNFPINFQLKAGAGAAHINILPDDESQFDPLMMVGGEMSFPAGTTFNIGLRIDYLMVYEKHLEGAKYNGHMVNVGLTVFMNL